MKGNRNGQKSSPTDSTPDNKVARLIDTYDLETCGDRLETLWTADDDKRESLRSLADRFNKRLLRESMADAGMTNLKGEVANIYRLLTEDDVSSGSRTEARKRLEKNGVNVDQLERDFVSYQAIRSYLKEFRNAEYESSSDQTRINTVIETVKRLQSRTRSIVNKNLLQLRNSGRLTLGEFRVFVDVTVLCESCQTQYSVVELLDRGACDCQQSERGPE